MVALGTLSLIGFPPSSGFFGKVGISRAAAELDGFGIWLVLGAILVASVGTLVAMSRRWADVFWGPPLEEGPSRGKGHDEAIVVADDARIPLRHLAPAALLLVASLAIFVVPGPLWEWCLQAADGLVDVSAYVEAVTAS